MSDEEWIEVEAAAAEFGVSRRTLERWMLIAEGKGVAVRKKWEQMERRRIKPKRLLNREDLEKLKDLR